MARDQAAVRTTRGIQQSLISFPQRTAIPNQKRGAVYTKGWVVELLLDLAGYRAGENLVDAVAVEPAAGDGAFLGPMIERLADSCRAQGRPITDCANSLVAYELNGQSAAAARTLAAKRLVGRGVKRSVAERLAETWVRTGDYLLDTAGIQSDFVVGNPPYVRLEDIPDETASLYRHSYATMRGRADLYIAFFEAALHQLRENGVCAFICADRWMRNQYGSELRELITSHYAVEAIVEMHNADAFHDEVDAYPAITVIRRKEQATTVIASAGPGIERVPSATLSAKVLATARNEPICAAEGLRTAVVQSWFQGGDPWPCQSPEQLALLRQLEERFPALEANARAGIGVATGHDDIFITKDSQLVEPSRLLKLGVVGDLRNGKLTWSGHYLVDPWEQDGLVNLDKFPKLKAYFEEHAAALKKRHVAAKNIRGWYRTIDRVTHSLAAKPKLYIADIKNMLDPVLDAGETYPHHNLYFIQSSEWDLEVLGGLLLSAIGQFFVESYGVRMRGGYLRFQAQYLRRIRVPSPSAVKKIQAAGLVKAFRGRDREAATRIAMDVYGISQSLLETALGHR